ncbi:MAG TPA: molybdopterin-dependent oxidoreductase [Puia sp.]
MKRIVKRHPLAIRWFHWINFPVLTIMIWSGLLIYWANDVYKIRLGGTILFQFFPESFYKTLGISYHLAQGMAFHFVFMWVFFLNGLIYVLYTWISGEWRGLVPDRHSFKEAWQVLLHDLHIPERRQGRFRRRTAPPQVKYNGAQKIAYSAIIVMGLGSVLTGLAIYKPVQFYWLCALFGGYGTARVIHFILTIGYCVFFLIHIVQVMLAGWNNFRAMIAGFEVVKESEPEPRPSFQLARKGPGVWWRLFKKSNRLTVEQQIQRRTLLSFSAFIVLGAAAWKSWSWLKQQPSDHGVPGPLRKGLNTDEKVFNKTLSPGHLAKTYPQSAAAKNVRTNGDIGLDTKSFDPGTWKFEVTRASKDTFSLSLDELRQLPKTEIVFDFKCIEGWSQISHWGGVKFSDFMKQYRLDPEAAMKYISLSTPDEGYYVGIDMASALHPQTLLCYEMNGAPLPLTHGYPLRLIIPVKYGIKSLKRIGSLSFSNERPPDYWFERGYDYFSGL